MNLKKTAVQRGCAILFLFVLQTLSAQYKMPVAYVSSQQPAQPGNEAGMCTDNNMNTLYHSKYSLSTALPDQLNFNFSQRVKSVSKVVYKPRQSGLNGIWTSVKIKYSTQASPGVFTDATGVINWAADNTSKTIDLPNAIIKPAVIRIEVLNAENSFSSCAEMEFYSTEQMDPVTAECALPTGEFVNFGDISVIPQAAGSTASSFQPGYDIDKSFDGDLNTLYHSNWSTTSFPVSLIYEFNGQTPINYLKYIPRQDGNVNGNFGNIKISYNTVSNSNYTEISTLNFEQTGVSKTAYFPSAITPLHIKIEVLDGKNNFASCAELQFFQTDPNTPDLSAYSSIFSDPLFSTLKPSVTQQDINAITSPFMKGLAQCLFNNTYTKKYRVQNFTAYKKNESINAQYKIGNYNAYENPAGIVFQPNTTVVIFAKDISSASNKVYLKIRDFATEGGTSQVSPENSYELKNGFNLLKITNGGLGYISYYTDDTAAAPISLNITAGIVNGIYKKGTASPEWTEMLTNDVYPKVDMQGYYTGLVMDKSAVTNFHYDSPQPLVDKYDMIVKSERELMGFFKYNKNVKNRQLMYTESVGGWFGGTLGVHLDLTWGMQNTASATGLDIWGVAHEFGHINQVRPGVRWSGTGEITNNIYSLWAYYNMHTPNGSNRFTRLEGEIADKTAFPQVEGNRYGEFIIQTQINGKNVMDQFRTNFVNPKDKNFRSLIPFWQLELYYQLAGASKGAATLNFDGDMSNEDTQTPPAPVTGVDYAHWLAYVVKKVTETDESQLSQGQLVMNFVKNTCDAVQEDLTDFFTNTGFLRPVDGTMDDYVSQQLTITQSMIDDVKSYVLSKGYAKPVSPVINYISANSVSTFKNLLPVSGITGVGAQIISNTDGRFLLIDNAQWTNAVAFETYDIANALISVSIVGTGDTTLANTYVDFPSSAQKVYAIGYNGQKILVYPAGTLAADNSIANKNNISVFPNPLKSGQRLNIAIKNAKGNLKAEIYDMTGQLLTAARGSVEEINKKVNDSMQNLKTGIYIISIYDGDTSLYQSKIIKE
ncbi:T9SS C-terminal target domain-containing protein [Chryseobacterium arthrosphaerae]|uniref:M60 family metallopeptidase n=1 Tax=Chryseobacterium arthrosphaerae TaxID=651561 RepID=UPI000F4F3597|nr:M60 family metallopeptidase [Chryseobacterium arthrosphaerae]AYZ12355.1 T9SS C-terminal target domain-containing protein [Chryseobacterium arthrosphaerae]